MDRLTDAKVLIYSHDSFGLGHLRRCRTIAHSLVDSYKGLSVLIVSGSPIISQFDFKSRVNFICIPGVVKLRNGDYTSLGLHVDIDQTLAIRSSIIQHTAEIFSPNIFIVDKEPLGLRGEVEHTLKLLKLRGTRNILGLRDVMDDAEALHDEWERKKVVPALDSLYDTEWSPEAHPACAACPERLRAVRLLSIRGGMCRSLRAALTTRRGTVTNRQRCSVP